MSYDKEKIPERIRTKELSWGAHGPDQGDHAQHLCNLVVSKYSVDEYIKLVKDSKFLCIRCGRTATEEKNLCESVPI